MTETPPVPCVLLETARLRLRAFHERDLDALASLHGDPEVMRFLTGGRPQPREDVAARSLPRLMRSHPETGTRGYWAAEEHGGGAFLGWFELLPLPERGPHTAELGYRLHRRAWGRGYATEGSRALIGTAFTDLGVERIVARTMAVNTASRRVMAKCGLRHVRTRVEEYADPIPGAEHGEVEYTLDRQEWRRSLGEE